MIRAHRMQLAVWVFGFYEWEKQLNVPRFFRLVPGTELRGVLASDFGRTEQHIPEKQEVAVVTVGVGHTIFDR